MNADVVPHVAKEEPCDSLIHEVLEPMAVHGVYARTGLYEQVVDGIGRLITQYREPDTEVFRFPPVMSRALLERSGYLNSFPNLLGCVSCLKGSEAEIHGVIDRFEAGEAWTDALAPADLVLSPASCYPVYPLAAQRGTVPPEGLTFDVAAECFRHEPSHKLERMQSFRMREYVRIGTPRQVAEFRTRWMTWIAAIADQLHLSHRIESASDPFFGRPGIFLAKTQVEQALKFELLIPVRNADAPTACMSLNYHRDHFGDVWGLKNQTGDVSHTSCVAFGMDRLAVAMFAAHGLDLARWPAPVLAALRLEN